MPAHPYTAPYTVHPVATAAQRRLFCAVPDAFYQGNPYYVRPNDPEIEAVFDPARNKLFGQGGAAVRWLMRDSTGRPAGRIAAFVNPAIQATEEQPTGGFGFFECPPDPAAATLLLDTARQWLEARGMAAMDGPVNFGDRDRFWGLHVQGFERLPSYGMFYHPPYYQALLEGYGLQVYFRQYSYLAQVDAPLHPRIEASYQRFVAQPHLHFDHAHRSNLEKLAQDIHRVYSLAWGNHAGVGDLSLDQTRQLVQKMKFVLDEKIIWFAYSHGQAVAFLIALPGLNQIFQRTGPKLNWVAKLRFLLERARWERRPDKLANAILYGVIPEFQGTGIDASICSAAQKDYQLRGYKELELVWIGDFNPKMMTVCRALGSTICKTHHTYRLYFDPTRPFERSPIIGRASRAARPADPANPDPATDPAADPAAASPTT